MTQFLRPNFARIVLSVSVLFLVLGWGMQSQVAAAPLAGSAGPNFAGTATSATWTGPSNATGAHDNNCATYSDPGVASIDLTNFLSSIPAGSTITGIRVEPKTGSSALNNLSAQLLIGGVTIGNVKNFVSPMVADCAGTTFSSLGGAGDLWGTSFTPSNINATTFGVRISGGGGDRFFLDAVRITVFFDPATPVPVNVPEADPLLLFGGGLGGLATWVGWQLRKRRGKK